MQKLALNPRTGRMEGIKSLAVEYGVSFKTMHSRVSQGTQIDKPVHKYRLVKKVAEATAMQQLIEEMDARKALIAAQNKI